VAAESDSGKKQKLQKSLGDAEEWLKGSDALVQKLNDAVERAEGKSVEVESRIAEEAVKRDLDHAARAVGEAEEELEGLHARIDQLKVEESLTQDETEAKMIAQELKNLEGEVNKLGDVVKEQKTLREGFEGAYLDTQEAQKRAKALAGAADKDTLAALEATATKALQKANKEF